MEDKSTSLTPSEVRRDVYSVWALPPEELTPLFRKLMDGLRSEFGGPQFEPHVTVVGATSLTESEARDRFHKACEGLEAYSASVEKVSTGTFFYQWWRLVHVAVVILVTRTHLVQHEKRKNKRAINERYKENTGLGPTVEFSSYAWNYRYIAYMPHLSLLYGDLTDEEKKKAQEKAYVLDDSIDSLNFQISRLALYKTDTEDKSCKSWEKVSEYTLKP